MIILDFIPGTLMYLYSIYYCRLVMFGSIIRSLLKIASFSFTATGIFEKDGSDDSGQ